MNSNQIFSSQRTMPMATARPEAPGVVWQLRLAIRDACRSYSESLVRRALMLDPAPENPLAGTVRFCDVR